MKLGLCLLLLYLANIDTGFAFTAPNARRAYVPSVATQGYTPTSILNKNGSWDQYQSNGDSMELRMAINRDNYGEQNLESGKGRKSIRSSETIRKLWLKCRHKVDSIMLWQRKNRRSTLAAAALFFSAVLSNHRMGSTSHALISSGSRGGSPSSMAKTQTVLSSDNHYSQSLKKRLSINRGGNARKSSNSAQSSIETTIEGTTKTFKEALNDLFEYMKGPKSDTLIFLLATALITPLCQLVNTSPILGFLASGMLLGPNGMGLISGIHTTETLAELGIVFFLFEMGIELSFDRLKSMRRDVFGLGMSQFLGSALAIAAVGSMFGIPANALVVLGGGLALSSSAFVLQLLKDKKSLATRFGKASFGVLLFQDLAVVPLLVVTPILAGGGSGLASAVGSALVKAAMAFTSIFFTGHFLLNPLFKIVAGAKSQEAFLGVVLLTALSMSFMTEGLGLSNTLGAFLAGVLLSETKYRYQIEADIAPFRGILLGLFFITVGFEIDLNLIASNLPLVSSIVFGTLALKTAITTIFSLAFGLSLSTALQTGLILSQGGEFAFVAFGLARNLGIFEPAFTKLLLTSVALTMAFTPLLADVGSKVARKLEEESDFTHYLGQDKDALEIADSEDFVVVVGYGIVGKSVCDLLDLKFIKYVGLEMNPNKAIQARNKGLPVFYGDIGRPEVAEAFNVGSAKAVIVCISDKAEATRALISLRRAFPDKKIFARAADADHAERLQRTLDVAAMVPVVPEDNILLTLPFGGAVLRCLGAEPEEVNAIVELKRKEVLSGKGIAEEEQELILAQLGIITEPKVVIEKKPMVAEVIETIKENKESIPIVDIEVEEITEDVENETHIEER